MVGDGRPCCKTALVELACKCTRCGKGLQLYGGFLNLRRHFCEILAGSVYYAFIGLPAMAACDPSSS